MRQPHPDTDGTVAERGGQIGAGEVAVREQAQRHHAPTISDAVTRGSPHPCCWDSISAYTVAASPHADNAAPATSTRACSAGPGTSRNQNVNAKPMTIGIADNT